MHEAFNTLNDIQAIVSKCGCVKHLVTCEGVEYRVFVLVVGDIDLIPILRGPK